MVRGAHTGVDLPRIMVRTKLPQTLLTVALLALGACGPSAPAPETEVEAPVDPTPTEADSPVELDPIDALDADGLPQVPPESGLELDEGYFKEGRRRYRRLVKVTPDGIVGHGAYVRWHKNGVPFEQGTFRDGQREGLFIERHEAGPIKTESSYRAGKLHGYKRGYAAAGFREREALYEDGLQHGPYLVTTSWYEGVLVTLIEGQFARGNKTGPWTYYYNKGERRDAGEFQGDLREGTWTTWYKSGELQLAADHHLGEWHGQVTEYDEQGRRLTEATYDTGVASGTRTEWYENGTRKSVSEFVAGLASGPMQTWFESGAPRSQGRMQAGQREGEWVFTNADGSLNEAWSGTYSGGVRVEDEQ